ncbi:MAG: hypothetical protein IBX52_02095 [Bacterioplanes sp.]|nr:hypothetical protein [Bacterioplanes sp.]
MNLSLIGAFLLATLLQSDATSISLEGLASGHIYNATFIDSSPDFTDLYIIMSGDRARPVTIYCNPRSCYRLRQLGMWV